MTAPRLLSHPFTGEPVPWFDPAVHHDGAGWKGVTCSNCGRSYVCTPWDDYMEPAPDLGHDGMVCEYCLLALAARKAGRP